MRVTPAQARAIQRGAKYQHRVPVDPRLTARPLRPASRHGGKPFKPIIGDVLPVDAIAGRTYCKITDLFRGLLGTLTDTEAKAEGHLTIPDFELAWVERHDKAWLDKQIAHLIANDISEDEANATRPMWAKSRYEDYWTTREVWLLEVMPFDDVPLLLPGLVEEPEAIPVERLKRRWTDHAKQRHSEAIIDARELTRTLLDKEQRIALLHRNAHMRGVDVSRELWLLRRRLPELTETSLEQHVRGIEGRIYRDAA